MSHFSRKNLLAPMLESAARLYIEQFQKHGGPSDAERREATDFAPVLAEKGDLLMFKSPRKGETAELFDRAAKAVAVLAFLPGGVSMFGVHFEAKSNET